MVTRHSQRFPIPSIRAISIIAIIALSSVSLIAQDIPLRNWAVPSTSSSSGKLIKQGNADFNYAAAFVPVEPCRVYDSRVVAGGTGPITGGTARTVPVSAGPCTGIGPPSAPNNVPTAFSLNLTVTGSTAGSGYSFATAYPTGTVRPGASSINFLAGAQVGNAAIVPAGTAGAIDIYTSLTTEVIVDINGYWAVSLDFPLQQFQVTAFRPGGAAIYGGNGSGTAGSHAIGGLEFGAGVVHGIQGETSPSATSGSSGVHGIQDSTATSVYGVLGEVVSTSPGGNSTAVRGKNSGTSGLGIGGWFSQAGSGWGVYATVVSGLAVFADAGTGTGVYTRSTTGRAVDAASTSTTAPADTSAIYATTGAQTTNRTFGITGQTNSSAPNSAGVQGIDASGLPAWYPADTRIPSGVVGLSKGNIGVFGKSEYIGVDGLRINANGTGTVEGLLGWSTYGVFSNGNMGATGTKPFVEPHPTDASQVIRYVALEGPEAGTYFRGRGRFVKGRAVIQVPESFRIVTDEEGITVNVTPMGGIASVGVMNVDLNSVEVQSNRDVEFSYLVQGVRKAYKDWEVMGRGDEYEPRGPEAKMPSSFSAEAKRRLIANGTYNADGSVNMSTAERLGWAKQWRDSAEATAKRAQEATSNMAAHDAQIQQQQQQ